MKNNVLIETSARHAHITQEHFEILFGKGASLNKTKDLSQPGEFATSDKITVVGSKGEFKVTILGPFRPATQIEISLTDARSLGLTALIRESGDVAGSSGCEICGPEGSVVLKEGVIAAKRHIHMTEREASEIGVSNKDIVSVKVADTERSATFSDVVVRVSNSYAYAMHIDTDEANAAAITSGLYGEIIK